LFERLRMMRIDPGKLQQTLKNIPQLRYLSANYSMSGIQEMQAESQSQSKNAGGQAEVSFIQPSASGQQPPPAGGFRMPSRGVGSFLDPQTSGMFSRSTQQPAFNFGVYNNAPPQRPAPMPQTGVYDNFNLSAPMQAPPTAPQAGVGCIEILYMYGISMVRWQQGYFRIYPSPGTVWGHSRPP
jgi:hypothetical protein